MSRDITELSGDQVANMLIKYDRSNPAHQEIRAELIHHFRGYAGHDIKHGTVPDVLFDPTGIEVKLFFPVNTRNHTYKLSDIEIFVVCIIDDLVTKGYTRTSLDTQMESRQDVGVTLTLTQDQVARLWDVILAAKQQRVAVQNVQAMTARAPAPAPAASFQQQEETEKSGYVFDPRLLDQITTCWDTDFDVLPNGPHAANTTSPSHLNSFPVDGAPWLYTGDSNDQAKVKIYYDPTVVGLTKEQVLKSLGDHHDKNVDRGNRHLGKHRMVVGPIKILKNDLEKDYPEQPEVLCITAVAPKVSLGLDGSSGLDRDEMGSHQGDAGLSKFYEAHTLLMKRVIFLAKEQDVLMIPEIGLGVYLTEDESKLKYITTAYRAWQDAWDESPWRPKKLILSHFNGGKPVPEFVRGAFLSSNIEIITTDVIAESARYALMGQHVALLNPGSDVSVGGAYKANVKTLEEKIAKCTTLMVQHSPKYNRQLTGDVVVEFPAVLQCASFIAPASVVSSSATTRLFAPSPFAAAAMSSSPTSQSENKLYPDLKELFIDENTFNHIMDLLNKYVKAKSSLFSFFKENKSLTQIKDFLKENEAKISEASNNPAAQEDILIALKSKVDSLTDIGEIASKVRGALDQLHYKRSPTPAMTSQGKQ